ncbi:hypothetical protein OSB04_un000227 [Centaurea solstitialis]|uniref:Uncharacterized protein n=1 Tax=Centaurea solstitialis TaxID=347529 RepID=A0AA38S6A6_9ASTR|nr:hypothetical protein OSB04_un000227 [Centaurea solstitialis]
MGGALCYSCSVDLPTYLSFSREQNYVGVMRVLGSNCSASWVLFMQKTKMIEPCTAHYVFALGVARFLGCAHWIIQAIFIKGHSYESCKTPADFHGYSAPLGLVTV